jgi:hypothetical protein
LEERVQLDELIDKIIINKYLLAREYGIGIEDVPNRLEAIVCAFPIF